MHRIVLISCSLFTYLFAFLLKSLTMIKTLLVMNYIFQNQQKQYLKAIKSYKSSKLTLYCRLTNFKRKVSRFQQNDFIWLQLKVLEKLLGNSQGGRREAETENGTTTFGFPFGWRTWAVDYWFQKRSFSKLEENE